MLFSFIVPTYNLISEVELLLIGLTKLAKVLDCEIIIVDDSSCDGTYEFLIKNAVNDKIQVYRTIINSGPATARNLGIDYANGDYVSFLDSDDSIDFKEEDISNQNKLSFFNNQLAEVIYMNCIVESRGGYIPFGLPELPATLNLNLIKYQNFPAKECWGVFFSSAFLKSENIRFPNVRLAEDQVFMTEVRLKMKSISSCSIFTYTHTANSTGLATRFEQNGLLYYSKCIQQILDLVPSYQGNELNFIKLKVHEMLEQFYWFAISFYKKDSMVEREVQKIFTTLEKTFKESDRQEVSSFDGLEELIHYQELISNYLKLHGDKCPIVLYCLSTIGMAIANLCETHGKPIDIIIDDNRVNKLNEGSLKFGASLRSTPLENFSNKIIIICHPNKELIYKIYLKIKDKFCTKDNIYILSDLKCGPMKATLLFSC